MSRNLSGNLRTTKAAYLWPGVFIAIIAVLTLWPAPSQAEFSAKTPFTCFPCGPSGGADFLRNIVFFLPLGVALGATGWSFTAGLLVAMITTSTAEFLQFSVIPGRDAALADIVANSLGGILGWVVGRRRWGMLLMPERTAAIVTVGWASIGVLGIGLMGWSLPTSLPWTTWYGQWAPSGNEPEWYTGEVLDVTLGHKPLPHWRLGDSQEWRRDLALDTLSLAATVITIAPRQDVLRIVAVADSSDRFVTLSQGERDLGFAVRTKAANLAFQTPYFVSRGAMPAAAGDTIAVAGAYWRGFATVNGRRLDLSDLDGWSLLVPVPLGSSIAVLVTIAYLVALFAPIGWYGGQVPSSAWAAAPVLILLADAVMVSRLTGTPLPASWEVACAALAALAGRVAVAGAESLRGPG